MAGKIVKYFTITAILVLTYGVAGAASGPKGSFTIDVKNTAAEQFDYASRLTAGATNLSDWHEAVIRSVAALDIIPKRWPKESRLIVRAYGEIITRLNDAHMHENAISYCDKAISIVGSDPERLVFVAAKARAQMWLGSKESARAAFEQILASPDFDRLDSFEKRTILLDKSFFDERNGDYRLAAKSSRERAKYAADDFQRVETLRKAVDLSLKAGDNENAKTDVDSLGEAAQKARMRNLKPEEQEFLRRVDAALVEYKKRLGKR